MSAHRCAVVIGRTPLPWSNAHLPNGWHLSADRVPIPLVPASGRARRQEIERRRRLLPDDLFYDDRYAPDFCLWETWLQDDHDTRRMSYFAGTVSGVGVKTGGSWVGGPELCV